MFVCVCETVNANLLQSLGQIEKEKTRSAVHFDFLLTERKAKEKEGNIYSWIELWNTKKEADLFLS